MTTLTKETSEEPFFILSLTKEESAGKVSDET